MDRSNIYLIWGNEPYLIDRKIEEIIIDIKGNEGEPEILYLDADELSAIELMEALDFSSLFFLRRVVVIKNPPWLRKMAPKKGMLDSVYTVLSDYLKRDNSGQILILTSGEYNPNNVIVKLLTEKGRVIHCKELSRRELLSWVKEEFFSRHSSLEPGVAELLAWSGQDMYYLQNLIEKICLIVKDRPIRKSDVEENLDDKNEIKVFQLTNALLNKDLKASFKAYYQLLNQSGHPIFFLYMIVRQFLILGKVKYYLEKGLGPKEIMNVTGLKGFTVKKMVKSARNFSWEEIESLFAKFLQADVAFKTSGKDEKIILETLIIEICSPK